MSELIPQAITAFLPDAGGLPDPDLVSEYVFQNQRRLYIDCDVDDNLLQYHRMIMRYNIEDAGIPREQRKPIWLYIHSYGGDLDVMWLFVDLMRASETPIYTVNLGVCASAASLIFITGEKRFMIKHGRVIVHEGSASISGDAVKVQDQAEEYKKELRRMKDYILENTKIPQKDLMRKRNNDWVLDSTFCLANGVCDAIIENVKEII